MKITVFLILLLVNNLMPTRSMEFQRGVSIYSGKCTCYKKTFVPPNQMKYIVISNAFGKLVVDRIHKHLNFYYNDQLIFSRDEFDSYQDTNQGGEGFTSYNSVDAHSFPAEGKFQINVGEVLYEIANYKVN